MVPCPASERVTIFTTEPCLLPTREPVGFGIAVPEVAIAAASLALPFDIRRADQGSLEQGR
jgi:hypothetical protein